MENPKGHSHETWSVIWRAPSDFVLFMTTRDLHRAEAMRPIYGQRTLLPGN